MTTEIGEDAIEQIKQQGTASYKVDDGEVFIFTTATLERLLEASKSTDQGMALVFVKTRETV